MSGTGVAKPCDLESHGRCSGDAGAAPGLSPHRLSVPGRSLGRGGWHCSHSRGQQGTPVPIHLDSLASPFICTAGQRGPCAPEVVTAEDTRVAGGRGRPGCDMGQTVGPRNVPQTARDNQTAGQTTSVISEGDWKCHGNTNDRK